MADRAAHAEQVRSRAAIAKAMPRAACREERAQAAQAAREKLLAEITARCEEEVNRAKKVAEETKQKKAAEHARLEEKMAEKLASAAKRKSLLDRSVRRPRTASLPAVEEKPTDSKATRQMSIEEAGTIISRSWKNRKLRKTLSLYAGLGVSIDRVKNMPFERVGQLLAQDRVLNAAESVLDILGLLNLDAADSLLDRQSRSESPSARAVVRIFLGAYLILGHPIQALSYGGKAPQEQDLVSKAGQMLTCVEHLVTLVTSLPNISPVRIQTSFDEITQTHNNYYSAFHAWKAQDSSALIDIMVNQFVELDMILQTTKNDTDGGVADDYMSAIRHNQIQLLAKLKNFAGSEAALARVKSAVRKARKQRALKVRRPSDQNVPRTSVSEPATNEPNSTLEASSTGPTGRSVLHTSEERLAGPQLVSRLGQTMTVLPTNREISHEIQMLGTFEVQQQPWTESRKQFMDNLRTSMRQSMESGGSAAAAQWTHSMAILVREKLLNLITRKHPLYTRIDGFLDPKLIEQQAVNGVFSYHDFFEILAGLIGQICSPGRDEAVKALAENTSSDIIDRLFELIDIIDLMTLDHINFAFRVASSQVIEHGHEHEMTTFTKDLQDNIHGLESTKRWWQTAKANAGPSPGGNAIYARGLVDLVLSNTHLSYAMLPETLRLDWLRLLSLRAKALRIAAIASILLTTKLRLRRNRESQWSKDADRLMSLDWTTVEASRVVAVIEAGHNMPDATREGLLNFVSRVLPTAAAVARHSTGAEQARLAAIQSGEAYNPAAAREDPDGFFTEQVATYVLKSLREHVFARLAASSTAEKVRVNTAAAEVLARAGMPEFVAEVGSMVDVLEKVRTVDLRAHEKWYDEITRDEVAA